MDIPGAEKVVSVFGKWPSFEDAEIVRLSFERIPSSPLGLEIAVDLHTFDTTRQVVQEGIRGVPQHVLVSFRFNGIDELQLEGTNSSDAILGLSIGEVNDGPDGKRYDVLVQGSFRVTAGFRCSHVAIEDVKLRVL